MMNSIIIKSEPSVLESIHQICRLCLSEEYQYDVLKEESLHQWISEFLSIKVSPEDRMSQAICALCRIRLIEFQQFRKRCQEVQGALQLIIQNEDVDAESELTACRMIYDSKNHACLKCKPSSTEGCNLQMQIAQKSKLEDSDTTVKVENQDPPNESKKIKTEKLEEAEFSNISRGESVKLTSNKESRNVIQNLNRENPELLEVSLDPAAVFMNSTYDDNVVKTNRDRVIPQKSVNTDRPINRGMVKVKLPANGAVALSAPDRVRTPRVKNSTDGVSSFFCHICQKQIQSRQAYVSHMRKSHGPKIYGCNMCDVRFNSQDRLARHIRSFKHSNKLKAMAILRELNKGTGSEG
ncbi:uncharacterized protein LOC134213530 [Armigeres subalbatus]|uniref:uncharacterized protein LOC134213530 n=1 Tax=Armigeres subalbatus TaxID=124917 RepID=UPI002ED1C386